MGPFPQKLPESVGRSIQALASSDPEFLAVGAVIDWESVDAPENDVVLSDDITIPAGEKYLRHGQVMARITLPEHLSVTIDATGGTWDLSLTVDGVTETLSDLAYNIAVGDLQTALDALPAPFGGNISQGASTAGSLYVLTFQGELADRTIEFAFDGSSLTGGGGGSGVERTQRGAASNTYGPYDPAANDGRQSLTRGECFIVNYAVQQRDLQFSDGTCPAPLVGGTFWKDRIIATSGGASKANGPTWSDLQAAMPRVTWVPGSAV